MATSNIITSIITAVSSASGIPNISLGTNKTTGTDDEYISYNFSNTFRNRVRREDYIEFDIVTTSITRALVLADIIDNQILTLGDDNYPASLSDTYIQQVVGTTGDISYTDNNNRYHVIQGYKVTSRY